MGLFSKYTIILSKNVKTLHLNIGLKINNITFSFALPLTRFKMVHWSDYMTWRSNFRGAYLGWGQGRAFYVNLDLYDAFFGAKGQTHFSLWDQGMYPPPPMMRAWICIWNMFWHSLEGSCEMLWKFRKSLKLPRGS